jgi:hypothetical protein
LRRGSRRARAMSSSVIKSMGGMLVRLCPPFSPAKVVETFLTLKLSSNSLTGRAALLP